MVEGCSADRYRVLYIPMTKTWDRPAMTDCVFCRRPVDDLANDPEQLVVGKANVGNELRCGSSDPLCRPSDGKSNDNRARHTCLGNPGPGGYR